MFWLALVAVAALCLSACSDDEAQRSGPPIGFARYGSSSGGGGFEESAKRDTLIVLQGFWRRDEIAAIRAANPACKILVYQNVSRTAEPDGEGRFNSVITRAEAEERGWDSEAADLQEPWLEFVEPNDAAGYGAFALERILAKLEQSEDAGYAVDGVFLDDDNSFAPQVRGGDPTSTAEEWDAWMEEVNEIVGPGLRERGYEVMANLSGAMAQWNLASGGWEERQFKHFTHVFDEFFAWWPDGTPQPQRFVDEAFRLAGAAADTGATFVGSVPDADDEEKAAFGLAMLLVATPGNVLKAPGRGDAEPWYDVHDRALSLGASIGDAEEGDEGVWTRDFENGSVRVDLGARTAEIRLSTK
jgi:hypothetical protein